MAWLGTLFGGGSPAQKTSRTTAETGNAAPCGGDVEAETPPTTQQLFDRALGRDRANSDIDARRMAATALVLANETVKGREAWLSIARDNPGELAAVLEQLGVCYHLEKDYRAALDSYASAIRVGADAAQLSANIAAARKELAALG